MPTPTISPLVLSNSQRSVRSEEFLPTVGDMIDYGFPKDTDDTGCEDRETMSIGTDEHTAQTPLELDGSFPAALPCATLTVVFEASDKLSVHA